MTIDRRIALGLVIALAGALIAKLLSFPLPWLLGPMLATASARMSGVPCYCPRMVRHAGQWVIGISLGLYFTPEVARHVAEHYWIVLFGVLYALFLGILGSWVLHRYADMDLKSAWFAASIGGASEMVGQAERYGARTDRVATVHSLRVLLVVVLIPFSFQWWLGAPGASGILSQPAISHAGPGGIALFVLGTWAAVFLFRKLRIPSAWVLAPMAFTILLSTQEIRAFSTLPQWVSVIGQLMIGWSLGDRYRPDFFRAAPRLLAVSSVYTVFMLLLSATIAYVLSFMADTSLPAMILGMAPGGIAEMTITAKVLGLGVPLVTAMQVVRMIAVVLLTTPLYRVADRWVEKRSKVPLPSRDRPD